MCPLFSLSFTNLLLQFSLRKHLSSALLNRLLVRLVFDLVEKNLCCKKKKKKKKKKNLFFFFFPDSSSTHFENCIPIFVPIPPSFSNHLTTFSIRSILTTTTNFDRWMSKVSAPASAQIDAHAVVGALLHDAVKAEDFEKAVKYRAVPLVPRRAAGGHCQRAV
jgi:hypothetical protein